MSSRKIIFFVIVGLVGFILLYGIWNLSQARKANKAATTETLTLWVVGNTTQQYETLFSEFKTFAPEYKNTSLDIRVFPDYDSYQKVLLSTLAEGNGPDIFMIEGGGDSILESQTIPIPESFLGLSGFEKEYEDIFLPLLKSEGTGKSIVRSLIGVPIGYETLGIFYHKSLIRSLPKTWAEVETLDIPSDRGPIYPINLGLGPAYTPDAVDLIAYFIGKSGGRSTKDLSSGASGLDDYLAYGTNPVTPSSENTDTPPSSLQDEKDLMTAEKLSTVDLFIRGKIAILIGFPSIIRELEKAEKRGAGDALGDLILTAPLPSDSAGKNRGVLARYRYLGISKKTQNPDASAKLLQYIMSDLGSTKSLEAFPLLLSPKRSLVNTQGTTPLSDVFARTRLDAFIPALQDDIFFFQYDIKGEYTRILRDYIDRNEKVDINNLIKTIQNDISCLVETRENGTVSEKCSGANEG